MFTRQFTCRERDYEDQNVDFTREANRHELGSWNQFAANEKLTNNKPSTYNDLLYTTGIPAHTSKEWNEKLTRVVEEIGVDTTPDQGHDKHRDEEDRYSSVTASKTQEPPVIKKLSNGMQLRPRASPNSSQTQEAIRIKSSPHSGSKHERKLKPPPSKQIKVSALPFYSVLLFIMNNNNNNQQDPDAILRSFISLLEAATYREHRRGPLGDGPAVLPDPRYLNSSRFEI